MKMRLTSKNTSTLTRGARAGFTLIEILVATTILASCFVLVAGSFSNVIKAKMQGEKMLESLHHGDFTIEQIAAAMRSAAFFAHTPEKFAFWHEDDGEEDIISWVTYSTAFMPDFRDTEEQLRHLKFGLHRIMLSVEEDQEGRKGLAVRAAPHLFDDEDFDIEEVEPWFVSYKVAGLDVRVYDEFSNEWEDEWEYERAIPHFVELNVILSPPDEETREDKDFFSRKQEEEYFTMTRMIEMPVGIFSKSQKKLFQEDQDEEEQNAIESQNPELTGGGIDPYQQAGDQLGNQLQPGIGGLGGAGAGNVAALRAAQQRAAQQQNGSRTQNGRNTAAANGSNFGAGGFGAGNAARGSGRTSLGTGSRTSSRFGSAGRTGGTSSSSRTAPRTSISSGSSSR